MSGLTAKEARFVREYLKDLNATQAAIRAGYRAHTAKQAGSRLLSNVDVSAAIDEAKQERNDKLQIDAEWVLKRLRDEAEADLLDLYDDNGSILPVEEWPLIWRQGLVTEVKTEELYEGEGEDRINVGRVVTMKVSDRIKRIELIGKHVKVNAFQDQVEVKGLDKLADRLERARKRLDELPDIPASDDDDGASSGVSDGSM